MEDGRITSLATFQENGMAFFEGMMDISDSLNTLIVVGVMRLSLGMSAKKSMKTNMKP